MGNTVNVLHFVGREKCQQVGTRWAIKIGWGNKKERVTAKRTHEHAPRAGRRREGKEEREIPRAVGRPRGCRPRSHGHVPNNSLGTRKQLLRNSCYRATLRVYISRCPSVATHSRRPSTQSRPARETFPPLLLPFAFDFEKSISLVSSSSDIISVIN